MNRSQKAGGRRQQETGAARTWPADTATAEDGALTQVVLVQNWFEELERLVPTP